MNVRHIAFAATLTALVVLTQASARPTRDPVVMRPMGGVTFDIGAERAVTYFLSDNGRCKLVLTQAAARGNDANFTATRFEATIDAGKATRYVSTDGSAIDFECHPDARSVSIRGVEPALADARRRRLRRRSLAALECTFIDRDDSLQQDVGSVRDVLRRGVFLR